MFALAFGTIDKCKTLKMWHCPLYAPHDDPFFIELMVLMLSVKNGRITLRQMQYHHS